MKKGMHPLLQWISHVTQCGHLMNLMITKVHPVGKVYHFRANRQMAQSLGQIAKFKLRYEHKEQEEPENKLTKFIKSQCIGNILNFSLFCCCPK
ncbi:hypothetical protein PHJA_001596800 [Phtheirospermum japonicum]|uniref:Ribosomal protein L31 n=1 Tax=Phtheirospermum japonicum TaxID=374723 RepID=A0A830CDZ0_9LAMI|nr:hypothetical protein PHJA_001596800 [Phtheirospermum japonicum]